MRRSLIVWLPEAIAEKKDDLLDYIAERNVLAALAIDAHIEQQVGQLVEFPFLGRKGRIANSFELVISSTPYLRIKYTVLRCKFSMFSTNGETGRRNTNPHTLRAW